MNHEEASATSSEVCLDLTQSLNKELDHEEAKMETVNEDQERPLQEIIEVGNIAGKYSPPAFSQQVECQVMSPVSSNSKNNVSLSVNAPFSAFQGVLPQLENFSNLPTSDKNNSLNLIQRHPNFDQIILYKDDGKILTTVVNSASISQQDDGLLISKKDPTHQESGLTQSQNCNKTDSFGATVGNLGISEGFLTPNSINNRPILHAAKTVNKTFAQIAAPPTVAASIPTRGTSPECGLLVERIKGSVLDEYVRALEGVTGKRTLVFIGQSPEDPQFVMAFLEQPALVNKVVSVGITIKGKWLCVTHLRQPASKLIISDVLPFIPDSIILNACKTFGQPVFEKLRRIPSSVRSQEYRHLLSFRRELLIVIDKKKTIPDNVVVFSHGSCHKLGITAPGLVCFNCKMHGHKAANCKQPRSLQMNLVSSGDAQVSSQNLSTHHTPGDNQCSSLGNGQVKMTESVQPKLTQIPGLWEGDKRAKEKKSKTDGSTHESALQTFAPPLSNILLPANPLPSDQDTITKKGTWLVAGKKGKAMPLKNSAMSVPLVAKAPKLGQFSDIAISRQQQQQQQQILTHDSSQSPDGSVVDVEICSTTKSNVNKRKKKQAKKDITELDTPLPMEETKSENSTSSQSQSRDHTGHGGVAQLKKILTQQRQQGNKSKAHNKEILLAQPIIEDLLNSVWSLRSSRRRAVLSEFQERHEQIFKYLDIVITVIPSDMHSSQVYRTLVSIKQDLKAIQPADSRKFRNSKN